MRNNIMLLPTFLDKVNDNILCYSSMENWNNNIYYFHNFIAEFSALVGEDQILRTAEEQFYGRSKKLVHLDLNLPSHRQRISSFPN